VVKRVEGFDSGLTPFVEGRVVEAQWAAVVVGRYWKHQGLEKKRQTTSIAEVGLRSRRLPCESLVTKLTSLISRLLCDDVDFLSLALSSEVLECVLAFLSGRRGVWCCRIPQLTTTYLRWWTVATVLLWHDVWPSR